MDEHLSRTVRFHDDREIEKKRICVIHFSMRIYRVACFHLYRNSFRHGKARSPLRESQLRFQGIAVSRLIRNVLQRNDSVSMAARIEHLKATSWLRCSHQTFFADIVIPNFHWEDDEMETLSDTRYETIIFHSYIFIMTSPLPSSSSDYDIVHIDNTVPENQSRLKISK